MTQETKDTINSIGAVITVLLIIVAISIFVLLPIQ